ncbi:hypothetical protein [Halomonas lysinitropha]|uniref:Uncharacterized protein n=1 Tax=Halomonas lysinitropha TaxID=2607506 RepID=A0A5K1I8F6_9GAMM|nr:hypothetical protein [Halomonas lysinitropha]VVZ96487.1 hypothetical protein HALO32_02587 [Halomonas lysinitropha]
MTQSETKGGTLARQAAMLCELPVFGLYLDQRRRWRQGLSPAQLPDGTHTPEDAADALRQACGIQSRAELDHNEQAAAMYRRIVADHMRWKRRAGL